MNKLFWVLVIVLGIGYAIHKFGNPSPAPLEQVITGGIYTVHSGPEDFPYRLTKVLSQENRRIYVKFFRIAFKARPTSIDLLSIPPGDKNSYAAMREDYFQSIQPKLILKSTVDQSELTPIERKIREDAAHPS